MAKTIGVNPATVIRDPRTAMAAYADAPEVAFDLETTGLSHARGRIAVIALCAPGKPPAVLHYPTGLRTRDPVVKWLETKVLVGHNITAFDVPFLARAGYRPFASAGWRDTMTTEQLIRSSDRAGVSAALDATIKRHLGKEIDKSIDHAGWTNPSLRHDQLLYAATDVSFLLDVHERQRLAIADGGLDDAYDIECEIAPVVASMVSTGMPIDDAYRREMMRKSAAEHEEALWELSLLLGRDVNPNSPKQVREAFNNVFGVVLPSTDVDTMLEVSQRAGDVGLAAQLVIDARKSAKTGMYDDAWAAKFVTDGRVHASYRTMNTITGRFNSSKPNMQQIPRKHRGMFAAPESSVLVSVDYSAIEVLVAGVLMKERKIVDAYLSGRDLHSYVASLVFSKPEDQITREERTVAKAASFTLLFAGGASSMIKSARDGGATMTQEEAYAAIEEYFTAFPQARRFIAWARAHADRRNAISLRIPMGPRRVMTKHGSDPMTAMKICNTLCQGTAAVGLKRALIHLRKAGLGDAVRAVVHDEIVMECREQDAKEVAEETSRAMKRGMMDVISVEPKTESKYGRSWS